MTFSQRVGVVLLALGVWCSVASGVSGISDDTSMLVWIVGGAILVLGASVLANSPGRED
jgi:hypothetical protein